MSKQSEIIAKIESLLGELKDSLGGISHKPAKVSSMTPKTDKAFSGLTGNIYGLVQDGFFKAPKAISEIQNKLQLEGIKKPTTALSGPLLTLIRKKVLERAKSADGKGTYKYRQRSQ